MICFRHPTLYGAEKSSCFHCREQLYMEAAFNTSSACLLLSHSSQGEETFNASPLNAGTHAHQNTLQTTHNVKCLCCLKDKDNFLPPCNVRMCTWTSLCLGYWDTEWQSGGIRFQSRSVYSATWHAPMSPSVCLNRKCALLAVTYFSTATSNSRTVFLNFWTIL